MGKKEAMQQKIEAEIEEQKAKLLQLKAIAKQKIADGKIGVYEEIEQLEKKLTEAKSKLGSLKDAGEEALSNLSQSIKNLFSKNK